MSGYITAQGLILFLTIYGLFYTERPYCLMSAAGLLMVVVTVENLSDKRSAATVLPKMILTAVCCVISHGFCMFLLWEQIAADCRGKIRIMFPPILFAVWQLFCRRQDLADALPIMIVEMAVLTAASALLWYIQKLFERYADYREQMSQAIGMLALNELKEKKMNRMLMLQSSMAERNARLEERENISRNIHNSVGHTITAASMALDAAETLWEFDSDRALDKVRSANKRIHTGLESIRHAVRVLDAETENISLDDFILELEAVVEQFTMDADVKVHFDKEVFCPNLMIVHEHTEFFTGAVQELFTNGQKHGHAAHFTLQLLADSSHIKITVADNGKSDFKEQDANRLLRDGFGLKKILQYIEKNGGSTKFTNENGFRTEMTIPIEFTNAG
ncbi:MAG: hypothetical protein HDQ95_01120 [Roseburia sp.]|nr:hypothetical protein [Roseburia sp.]